MDPNVSLEEALRGLLTEDREDAVEHLSALASWLDSGGFFPGTKVIIDDLSQGEERS